MYTTLQNILINITTSSGKDGFLQTGKSGGENSPFENLLSEKNKDGQNISLTAAQAVAGYMNGAVLPGALPDVQTDSALKNTPHTALSAVNIMHGESVSDVDFQKNTHVNFDVQTVQPQGETSVFAQSFTAEKLTNEEYVPQENTVLNTAVNEDGPPAAELLDEKDSEILKTLSSNDDIPQKTAENSVFDTVKTSDEIGAVLQHQNVKKPELKTEIKEDLNIAASSEPLQSFFADKTSSVSAENTQVLKFSGDTADIENLSNYIEKAFNSSPKEIEIQLEPENLGRIIIKAALEDGKAKVEISCFTQQAKDMLAENANNLGAILQNRMGQTDVYVDIKNENIWNPNSNPDDGSRSDSHSQRKQKKEKDSDYQSDFLQQLRLGIQ